MSKLVATIWHLLGIAVLVGGEYYANFTEDTFGVQAHIIHPSSMVVVFVGIIGLVMATTHYKDLWDLFGSLFRNSPSKIRSDIAYMDEHLQTLTAKFYESGAEGLKKGLDPKNIPMAWKRIFDQIEAKIEMKDIKLLVQRHESNMKLNLDQHIKTLQMMAAAGPTLGMLGTVLGLVKLLAELSDFSKIGSNMALALLTTLYGIFCSIMLTPLVSQLENKQTLLTKTYEQVLFWIEMVQDKKPSFYLEQSYDKDPSKKGE